jgi:hypothetical protein
LVFVLLFQLFISESSFLFSGENSWGEGHVMAALGTYALRQQVLLPSSAL